MNRKILAAIVVIIVIVSAVGAIIMLQPSSEGESDITIAYSQKVNYETIMVANDEGMFEDQGLNITAKIVTGGIQAAEALITASTDLAAMGDAPAVQLMTKDTGARIVARFIGGAGMHRFIAWNDIVQPTDLEGMKVGLQQGSSTHGAFLQWCQANDVNADNITFVFMNPIDIPLAMSTRQIDAMAGSEPWAVNTENLCGDNVHELGNSSELGSTFPIVLVASEKALQEKAEAIKKVLKALDQANQFIVENWDEAMLDCANHTGLSVEDQSNCSIVQFYEVGFNATDVQSITMTAMALLSFGKINEMPVIMDNVDLSYLPED
ncbi:MAG: ABC transporter substrate-binding protein [Methanomassiliicoccales archaeon]|nr:ABC transporter substrate-binding protein [Methanomassiliicoccales archaeon]